MMQSSLRNELSFGHCKGWWRRIPRSIWRSWSQVHSLSLSKFMKTSLVMDGFNGWMEGRLLMLHGTASIASTITCFSSSFLDATSPLYIKVCVRLFVRRSILRSIQPSLRRLLVASYAECSALFWSFLVLLMLNLNRSPKGKRWTPVPLPC